MVLCRELLIPDLSADFSIAASHFLSEAIWTEFHQGRADTQLLNQVLACVRDAAKICRPDSHFVFYALARTLRTRFAITRSINDYEEATALLDRILDPNQPGEGLDQIGDLASSAATELAFIRSTIFHNPEYSEVTISRLRTYLSSGSVNEQFRFIFTGALAMEVRKRFGRYNLSESLEEANSSTSQLFDIPSSGSREKYISIEHLLKSDSGSYTAIGAERIQHFEGLLSTNPPGTNRHNEGLRCLAFWYESKSIHTNDLSDIEESIKYSRLSLNAAHSDTVWRINSLSSLRDALRLAFKRTGKISYLDESITIGYDIFESTWSSQQSHFNAVLIIVESLFTRAKLLGTGPGEDLHEIVRLIPMVIDNPYVHEPGRFLLSCQCAFAARSINHPTTLTAYQAAMTLMQKSLSFAPTVSIQHTHLVNFGKGCQIMPLDYASYQIRLGRSEEAVETLEQGRALLWSEMRGLRVPVAELIEDSPLVARLAEINQELGAMTISVTPSGRPVMVDDVAQGGDGTDPFGQLVVKRQKLVEERDALISQIQGQPGLQGILSAPSLDRKSTRLNSSHSS